MHSQTNICMGQPWLPVMKIEHGVLKNKNQIYFDGVRNDEVKFGTKYKNRQKLKLKILVFLLASNCLQLQNCKAIIQIPNRALSLYQPVAEPVKPDPTRLVPSNRRIQTHKQTRRLEGEDCETHLFRYTLLLERRSWR